MYTTHFFSDDEEHTYTELLGESSFLQSWQWGEFQKTQHRKPLRVVIRHNEQPVLVVQALRYQLPGGYHYFYIPFGPSMSSKDDNALQYVIDELCKIPKTLFVRIEPPTNLGLPQGAKKVKNIQPAKTLILDLSLSEESLLTGMHPKTRYNIKVAQRQNISIIEAHTANDLLEETARRHNYKGYTKNYYQELLNNLPRQAKIIEATHEGETLATGLYLDFGNTRTYLFGGSSEHKKNLMAPYLLHWHAITEAKRLGMKYYDFWGIETAKGTTPGFVRFKLGFGGTQIDYPGAYDITKKPVWYNTYTILRKVNSLL